MSTRPKSRKQVSGITKVIVQGYKSLAEESSIVIRPLTILAGANSSGKSSILQPLLLLKQTLESSYDPGPLLLYGPNVRFTSTEQVLSKLPRKKNNSFSVGVEVNNTTTIIDKFRVQPKKGFQLTEMSYIDGERNITIHPEMTEEEIQPLIPAPFKNILSPRDGVNIEWEVERERCFFNVVAFLSSASESSRSTSIPLFDPGGLLEDHIRRLIHLPGLRGNPERTYKTTAVGHLFPGTFEAYISSIVNYWQDTNDDRLRQLGSDLEALGLTWKVETRRVDDTQVELRVGRLRHSTRGGAKDLVNIADVGFGVSQTLPVLVALLTASPGQIVYLEQPEIHLHPRAQSALAQVLAEAANRGVHVVVETHSTLLILAVQTLVAEGHINSNIVKLHWFRRDDQGTTDIVSADLDSSGTYGDWPEDFADVVLENENRYLDAVELRQKRK